MLFSRFCNLKLNCNIMFALGGLKLWECTIDLVETLRREIQDGQLSFRGKRVLEVSFKYLVEDHLEKK